MASRRPERGPPDDTRVDHRPGPAVGPQNRAQAQAPTPAAQDADAAAFLSTAFEAAAAARTAAAVTLSQKLSQTTMDDDRPFYHTPSPTSLPLDRPTTETLGASAGGIVDVSDSDNPREGAPVTSSSTFATVVQPTNGALRGEQNDGGPQTGEQPDGAQAQQDGAQQNGAQHSGPQGGKQNQNTAIPSAYQQNLNSGTGGGLSRGELAAAIVVPVVVSLALLVLAAVLLRRRRRTRARSSPLEPGGRPRDRTCLGVGEKWGSLRSSASSQGSRRENGTGVVATPDRTPTADLDPASTSSPDTSYTPARRTTFADAPPPYRTETTPATTGPPLPAAAAAAVAAARPPHDRLSRISDMSERPRPSLNLSSPISPLSPAITDYLVPWSHAHEHRPGSSRSARSINSDAYSDTASIHSARAARMSVGGPTMIKPSGLLTGSRAGSLGDPFDDPTTPVPSLPGDALARLEGRRHGSDESKEMKP